MSIQVSSSVHAAVTLYVMAKGREDNDFVQSPAGCILQRATIEPGDASGWIVLLNYGLDSSSMALCCVPLVALSPPTRRDPVPVVPVLFHIDDNVKVLVLVGHVDGRWKTVDQSFHAMFMSYQGSEELFPVELVEPPSVLPSKPEVPL